MKIKTEKFKDCEIRVTVSLDEKDLADYLKKAEESLSVSLKLDGFRKGKAPSKMVREKVGDKIKEKALEIAIKDSFTKILEQEKIDLIETIDMKVFKNEPNVLEYEARLLVSPEIVLGDYKNITIEQNTVQVTEKEIENTLRYIQKARADYKKADGPIKKGDRVEVDFEAKDEEGLIEGGKSENHPLIVGNDTFIPGFEDQLVGMRKGDRKNFSLVAPRDFYQKSIAGKKIDFDVRVKEVQEVTLPKIDDAFVKALGNFSNLDDLRKSVSDGIAMGKEAKERERIHLVILDKILDASKIEIPRKLAERQLDLMLRNFDESLHRQGLELSLYLAQIKKTQDDLRKDWYDQAVKRVKSTLILREIGAKEGITVDEEEILAAMDEALKEFGTVKEAGAHLDPTDFKDKVRNNLLNEKVLEFLENSSRAIN